MPAASFRAVGEPSARTLCDSCGAGQPGSTKYTKARSPSISTTGSHSRYARLERVVARDVDLVEAVPELGDAARSRAFSQRWQPSRVEEDDATGRCHESPWLRPPAGPRARRSARRIETPFDSCSAHVSLNARVTMSFSFAFTSSSFQKYSWSPCTHSKYETITPPAFARMSGRIRTPFCSRISSAAGRDGPVRALDDDLAP